MKIRILKNPVARKRFLRFKSMKRAYFSLWIICILYGLSLFSEVLCNNVPLYVKYNGRSYFPVVQYHSENEFTGNGRQTRPDYRLLSQSPAFADNSENFMIFPLIPYSPLESINSKAIFISDEVELKLARVPQIGTVDIHQDFTIVRAMFLESFINYSVLNDSGNNLQGENLEKYFILPDMLEQSISARFANQAAGFAEFMIQNLSGENFFVSLSTYRPRKNSPRKIRLTLKGMVSNKEPAESIVFNRSL